MGIGLDRLVREQPEKQEEGDDRARREASLPESLSVFPGQPGPEQKIAETVYDRQEQGPERNGTGAGQLARLQQAAKGHPVAELPLNRLDYLHPVSQVALEDIGVFEHDGGRGIADKALVPHECPGKAPVFDLMPFEKFPPDIDGLGNLVKMNHDVVIIFCQRLHEGHLRVTVRT